MLGTVGMVDLRMRLSGPWLDCTLRTVWSAGERDDVTADVGSGAASRAGRDAIVTRSA